MIAKPRPDSARSVLCRALPRYSLEQPWPASVTSTRQATLFTVAATV